MSDVPWAVWAVIATLLGLSGLFSSSETALFSLTRPERAAASAAVQRLIADPRRLLISILLGNLIVNVLFFAVAGRLLPGDGGLGDLTVGLCTLVSLLICGEILPKVVGLRARSTVARTLARPLWPLVALLGPVGTPLVRMLDALAARLVGRDEKRFSPEVLAHVMERGAAEGELLGMEADLVGEVVELDQIRVREIMTPRVDALFLDVSGKGRQAVVDEALERRQSWLAVVDQNPDRVVGRVRLLDLLRHPERSVGRMVMPVKFVPEVASALDLLRSLREDRTAEAVVVDEWGGTAGFVTAEDVFEEIVGDLRTEGEMRVPAVVPLGERRYRVAGGLSIRDWNDAFGRAVVPTEFETVGGFVTALLGRIPRSGDVARFENLVMEVHEVRGRRVSTVDIGLAEEGASLPGAVRP